MKRVATALVALAACESPPAPPKVDDPPPLPRADRECSGASPKVGGGTFHFADLDTGRSCEVLLEQDECVLSIFQDCSNPLRQWWGALEEGNQLDFAPVSIDGVQAPRPTTCDGTIDGVGTREARVAFKCAAPVPHLGIALVAKDAEARPIGHASLGERIRIFDPPGGLTNIDDPMPAVLFDDVTRDLYAVVQTGELQTSGVYRMAAGSGRFEPMPGLRFLDGRALVSAGRPGQALAVGSEGGQPRVFLLDLTAGTIVRSSTIGAAFTAISESTDGETFFVGTSGGVHRVTAMRVSDLASGRSFTQTQRVAHLIALPRVVAAGERALLVVSQSAEATASDATSRFELRGGPNLARIGDSFEFENAIYAMHQLEGETRVGFVTNNAYWEVDWTRMGFAEAIPVPFTSGFEDFWFDRERNRVYVGGYMGASEGGNPEGSIALIDRAAKRALQPALPFDYRILRLVAMGETIYTFMSFDGFALPVHLDR